MYGESKNGTVDGPFLKYSPLPDRKHEEGDTDDRESELVPIVSCRYYTYLSIEHLWNIQLWTRQNCEKYTGRGRCRLTHF